jgi:hypothetical protein
VSIVTTCWFVCTQSPAQTWLFAFTTVWFDWDELVATPPEALTLTPLLPPRLPARSLSFFLFLSLSLPSAWADAMPKKPIGLAIAEAAIRRSRERRDAPVVIVRAN